VPAAGRVRELTAEVTARHRVHEARPALEALVHDDVPRVRVAARRALEHRREDDQAAAA
jgi:hypothetical protein